MSSVLACFLFYFHCSSLQFTQPSPLQNLPCSGWPGPCNLAGRASLPRPPALRPPWAAWAARRRAVPSGESPPRQRPPASSGVRAVGASSRGRSNRSSGAPGGRFQSVPFLRRPSQGLRFSRQTRSRAPEAGIIGGDNSGVSETWACLLVLKIGPAVV